MTSLDIRCACGRLLGRATPAGSIEIRQRGELLATVERGTLHCARCGARVVVAAAPARAAAPLALAAAGG